MLNTLIPNRLTQFKLNVLFFIIYLCVSPQSSSYGREEKPKERQRPFSFLYKAYLKMKLKMKMKGLDFG